MNDAGPTMAIIVLAVAIASVGGLIGYAVGNTIGQKEFKKEAIIRGHAEYYKTDDLIEWRWKEEK